MDQTTETAFRAEMLRIFGEDFGPARWYRPPIALRFELATGRGAQRLDVAENRCFELLKAVAGNDQCLIELTTWGDGDEPLTIATQAGLVPIGAWQAHHTFVYKDDEFGESRLSARVTTSPEALRWLAHAVVHAEHVTSVCDEFRLYLLNPLTETLVHPYDDRGADVYTPRIGQLRTFYERFGAWLLPYNRDGADRMMTEGVIPSWPDPLG